MDLFESHAHLEHKKYKNELDKIIHRAKEVGVKYIVNVGSNLSSSYRSLTLSQTYSEIYATVGIHPHEASEFDNSSLQVLKDLAKADKVVAIGEIGLDYYYEHSPRDIQKKALRAQLTLAKSVGLPVVIHNREADQDILNILKNSKIEEIGGVLHCFSSDITMAKACLDLGLYLGFGGVITFKKAKQLRQVVQQLPLSRILLETDCPYLSPHPLRGKRNEPAYLKFIAQKIGEIKGISLEEVVETTTANACKFYGIKK